QRSETKCPDNAPGPFTFRDPSLLPELAPRPPRNPFEQPDPPQRQTPPPDLNGGVFTEPSAMDNFWQGWDDFLEHEGKWFRGELDGPPAGYSSPFSGAPGSNGTIF